MPIIFSTHSLHPHAVRILEQAGEFVVASAPDQETLLREGREADVIIVRAPLPAALFDDPPRLRAVIRHGAGLDMIPVEAATEAGVLVANVPGVNAPTVAEHVMMVTLALQRRFRLIDRDLRRASWTAARAHADLGHEIAGRTMGIVGMGAVGRALSKSARSGFGLNVITATRSSASLPEGALRVDLDTLVAQSDVIVLCCPLTAETRGLIDRERIGRMKRETLLINVSRGPVVDEAALLTALQNGSIAGAALDVFSTQPLPADHPLLALDNVILTPHVAGITDDSMMRMGTGAAEEAVRVLSGKLPRNLCNPQAEALFRSRFPADAG